MTYIRPREKIAQRAIHSLSEHELLQAIIGSGISGHTVRHIARKLQRLRASGRAIDYATLMAIDGIGAAQAARIAAVFELTRRYHGSSRVYWQAGTPKQSIGYTSLDASGDTIRQLWLHRQNNDNVLLRSIAYLIVVDDASALEVSFSIQQNNAASTDKRLLNNLLSLAEILEVHPLRVGWSGEVS